MADRKQSVSNVFSDIAAEVAKRELGHWVTVEVDQGRLLLQEATFQSNSACVDPNAAQALRVAAPYLLKVLQKKPKSSVLVEGHTDSRLLTNSSSSVARQCARFDDNYTLSTARAREAREKIVDGWPEDVKLRVGLAGFGASRPIPSEPTKSRKQRRVNISFREAD